MTDLRDLERFGAGNRRIKQFGTILSDKSSNLHVLDKENNESSL